MELYEYAIGAIIYAAGWYSSYKANFAKLHNYKHLLRLQKNIGNTWRSKYNELKRDKSSCSLVDAAKKSKRKTN